MDARVAGTRFDLHAAHRIDSRIENLLTGRAAYRVTFAVSPGRVVAMNAVTRMRAAAEAHHKKEERPKQ